MPKLEADYTNLMARIASLEKECVKWRAEAHTDALTGLQNRRAMFYSYPDAPKVTMYVTVIDLDGFKEINDTYGHDAGDKHLQMVAKRLQYAAHVCHGTVYRTGGDEFILISYSRPRAGLGDSPMSVGTFTWTGDMSLNDAILRADKAMYEDKQGKAHARRVQRSAL